MAAWHITIEANLRFCSVSFYIDNYERCVTNAICKSHITVKSSINYNGREWKMGSKENGLSAEVSYT